MNIIELAGSAGYETGYASTFFFGVLPLYGLCLLTGFILAAGWALLEWNRKGYRTYDFLFMTSFTTIFALYGAKLWYMVFAPVETFGDVQSALDVFTIVLIPAFGRSILGTIVCTPIGLLIWQRVWGGEYKTLELIDIVMPAMFLAQAVGRFGNLFDHNVYGGIIDQSQISWLPDWMEAHLLIDGEYRQPLFLYESMADLAAFVLLIIIFKTNGYWKNGTAGFFYIGTYGLIRSCVEPFRDEMFKMSWGDFPTTFIISIILLIVGFTVFVYLQWGHKIREKINTYKGV